MNHTKLGNGNRGLAIAAGSGSGCEESRDESWAARANSTVDLERIRRAVREILLAVGENPDREGLRETPDRVARMYDEIFGGLRQDPAAVLQKRFTEKYDEMVLVK